MIQGPKSLATELRLDKYPLNVLIVDDIKPYKERKVAILNGAHTALVPVAFQAGLDTVGEAMNDAEICAFVEKLSTKKLFRYWICLVMNWNLSPVQSPGVSVTRTLSISCCLSRSTV